MTVESAFAPIFTNENVIVQRTDTPASVTVISTNSAVMKFNEIDSNQIYQFRLTGDGSRLDIIDITNNRIGFVMKSDTGNIGIGTTAPTEQLDVNGNLRVRGDITATGNLNISPNGDLCLGNCP